MTDEIDETRWLPRSEPILTRARSKARNVVAVQGDNTGYQLHSLACPLDFYVAKQQITGKQYRAGGRLRLLWAKSVQSPYVQARYDNGEGGGATLSFIPLGMFAVEYRDALYIITSPKARAIAHSVCCEDIPASRVLKMTSRRTAERKSMAYLREALDQLAEYFKHPK